VGWIAWLSTLLGVAFGLGEMAVGSPSYRPLLGAVHLVPSVVSPRVAAALQGFDRNLLAWWAGSIFWIVPLAGLGQLLRMNDFHPPGQIVGTAAMLPIATTALLTALHWSTSGAAIDKVSGEAQAAADAVYAIQMVLLLFAAWAALLGGLLLAVLAPGGGGSTVPGTKARRRAR